MMFAVRKSDGSVWVPRGVYEPGLIADGYDLASEDEKTEWAPWTVDEKDLVKSFKFNPNHRPAGPGGGQFAPREGGGVADSSGPDKPIADGVYQEHGPSPTLDQINAQIQAQKKDLKGLPRAHRLRNAMAILEIVADEAEHPLPHRTPENGYATKFAVRNGRVLSAILYVVRPTEVEIGWLGSVEKGQGSYWIREIEKIAKSLNLPIRLNSLDEALPFYQKHGFVQERPEIRNTLIKTPDKFKSDSIDDDDDVGALAVPLDRLDEFNEKAEGSDMKPSKGLPVVSLKEWDESKHPRVPEGSGRPSGRFTEAGGGGGEGGEAAGAGGGPKPSGLSPERMGDKKFVEIESALAKKMGMEFTGSNDRGQNQFKVVDKEAFNKAVEEYNTRPDAWGGQILNTDIAREISPDYLKDRTLAPAVHEPASEFIKTLYAQKLAEPLPDGKSPTVLFTAGGTGAGKSTGLELADATQLVKGSHIIYDTNMNTYASARAKVAQAMAAGHNVAVMAVYRDPIDAMRGALMRAKSQEEKFGTGRTVPIGEHAKTHSGYQPVIQKLDDEFGKTGRFIIVGVDNSLGRGNARIVPFKSFKSVPPPKELEPKLHEVVDEAFRKGEISEPIYRGFKVSYGKAAAVAGRDPTVRRVGQEVRRGVRAGPQQAGQRAVLPVVKLKG